MCIAHHTEEFLQEHHYALGVRLQPLVREITDARARSREELEGLSVYAILRLLGQKKMVVIFNLL